MQVTSSNTRRRTEPATRDARRPGSPATSAARRRAEMAAPPRTRDRFARRDQATALLVTTYAFFGVLAVLGAGALGRDAFVTESALGLDGSVALFASVVMGVIAAGGTIAASRVVVRTGWGRALHADLRPAVRDASERGILLMALASGLGEELVFRGLLVPFAGIALSSAAFGLLHQVRGRARWAWAGWAALTGVVFAAIFVLTGSLAGPIVAHVAINFVNLRHLRDTDVAPPVTA